MRLLLFMVATFFSTTLFANMRTIEIAGLVVNANDMAPLENAKIFDAEGHLLGVTDTKGYYKVSFKYHQAGAIRFRLRVSADGFKDFWQRENWAELSGNIRTVRYFGLHEGNGKSFSSAGGSKLSYADVSGNFTEVKQQQLFERKLSKARTGNEKVFFLLDDKYYIVNNTGWIMLNSEKDSIIIDNGKVFTADKINEVISRKDVRQMTPVSEGKFAIHTKKNM